MGDHYGENDRRRKGYSFELKVPVGSPIVWLVRNGKEINHDPTWEKIPKGKVAVVAIDRIVGRSSTYWVMQSVHKMRGTLSLLNSSGAALYRWFFVNREDVISLGVIREDEFQ